MLLLGVLFFGCRGGVRILFGRGSFFFFFGLLGLAGEGLDLDGESGEWREGVFGWREGVFGWSREGGFGR